MAGLSVSQVRVAQARLACKGEDGEPLKQVEAARLLDVHPVTLNRIENGKAKVSRDLLDRMVDLYGRSREFLLGEPETIDEFELARERMAIALSQMAGVFEDFSAAVKVLEERAARAGDSASQEVAS